MRSASMETTRWPRRPGILSRLLGCPESVWEAAFLSARPSAPVTYHGDYKVIIPVLEAVEEPEDYRGQPKGDVLH